MYSLDEIKKVMDEIVEKEYKDSMNSDKNEEEMINGNIEEWQEFVFLNKIKNKFLCSRILERLKDEK